MKNHLLLLLLSLLFGVCQAQKENLYKVMPDKAPEFTIGNESQSDQASPITVSNKVKPLLPELKGTDIVNPIEIGQAANAFGFAFHRTTYLWADNNINSVSFIHRMTDPPGSGYLAFDLSKDGGETWDINIQTYDPNQFANARYPQGVLYNPVGNTNPDSAYFHYFAPALDGSNGNWGGYIHGVKQLYDGAPYTMNFISSPPGFYHYLPSGFTITKDGVPWMIDEENDVDAGTYTGNLIISKGDWLGTDFEYNFEHIPFEIHPDDGINDVKIDFAPDGQTGWICVLSNFPELLPHTSYHPIFMKTEDGGESWEDPVEVQLGGEDGLEAVKQFITDENLEAFFAPDPVPPRDEIDYYMGYHMDIATDAWGNPHINGMICIADAEAGSIYPNPGLMAMFHIYSMDQGETWQGHKLEDLQNFDAEFTNSGSTVVQYNRPQVATSDDGAIVFFSWLDTHLEGVEDNSQPDIFFKDYQPILDVHGDVENVTEFSSAMWTSHFGCMSRYAFTEVTDEMTYTCTIPFVYELLDNGDPLAEVQFMYIPDFIKTYTLTDIQESEINPVASVSQNYPNPASDVTNIKLNLFKSTEVSIDVINISGQLIQSKDHGILPKGITDISIHTSELPSGIYFYKITAGTQEFVKKLMIQ